MYFLIYENSLLKSNLKLVKFRNLLEWVSYMNIFLFDCNFGTGPYGE